MSRFLQMDSTRTDRTGTFAAAVAVTLLFATSTSVADEAGWIELFDGKSLDGWTANENVDTFSVKDGMIVVAGPRSHLFYSGSVENHNFKNFHWKCEVMTKPNANSGMYFHTKYQDEGWPAKGYEVQVNNTHRDPKKTGGLYAVKDVMNDSPAKDDQWFTQEVIVKDRHVTVKVDGEVTTEYTEPESPERPAGMENRLIDTGTFALQGHDPGSVIYYRRVAVKPLP